MRCAKGFGVPLVLGALLTTVLSTTANAYIPDHKMILSRVAENHGRGAYLIEQSVSFDTPEGTFSVKENWVVQNEHSMAVEVSGSSPVGKPISGLIVYDSLYRYFLNEESVPTKSPLGEDWWMPFFHFRYSKNIRQKLVDLEIVPASVLGDNTDAKFGQLPRSSFLRLSRTGGVVTYAFEQAKGSKQQLSPALWIEQDQFVVRKLRLPSSAEISASGFESYPRFQHQPQITVVRWEDAEARIQLLKLVPLHSNHELLKRLSSSFLTKTTDKRGLVLRIPEDEPLRSFYRRFR